MKVSTRSTHSETILSNDDEGVSLKAIVRSDSDGVYVYLETLSGDALEGCAYLFRDLEPAKPEPEPEPEPGQKTWWFGREDLEEERGMWISAWSARNTEALRDGEVREFPTITDLYESQVLGEIGDGVETAEEGVIPEVESIEVGPRPVRDDARLCDDPANMWWARVTFSSPVSRETLQNVLFADGGMFGFFRPGFDDGFDPFNP